MCCVARPIQRLFAAFAAVFFQAGIVATGNYAWINFIGQHPLEEICSLDS
jgi:hypothetical protein